SNYVMLNTGQPTHAFDAGKISKNAETLEIIIREAADGEKVTILTGETVTLKKNMYVIADATKGDALDVCGVKGGLGTGVTNETADLFVSVGNYDPVLLRRTAQSLKIFTDASLRFQNNLSPEIAAFGMRDLLKMITDVAGGTIEGVIDDYAM